MDLRTIGRCVSPLIVDNSPPVAGIVNDGEIHGVDLDFTKYEDKVTWLKYLMHCCQPESLHGHCRTGCRMHDTWFYVFNSILSYPILFCIL